MQQMLKNEKLTIVAFFLAISEGIYYTFKARDYAYMEDYMIHIALLITVILQTLFLYIFPIEPHKQKRKNGVLFILYGILIGLPIYYFIIQPQYTFHEAEFLIEQKEKVELLNKDNVEKFTSDHFGWRNRKIIDTVGNKQLYLVSAIQNDKLHYYTVEPRTGEYFLIEP
ncbi:hypothetical protein [Paenisporosarcina sp. NPDC076898]|uniref:hypothetical protein n=1 Tax=unclassified Paenisporosarcina TaxID=2642018 RepID=UPI003D02F8FB